MKRTIAQRKQSHTKAIPDLYRETVNIGPEAENPTPWPIRIQEVVDQLARRVAKLEADADEFKNTVMAATSEELRARMQRGRE